MGHLGSARVRFQVIQRTPESVRERQRETKHMSGVFQVSWGKPWLAGVSPGELESAKSDRVSQVSQVS